MKINNHDTNINFGTKINTINVLETAAMINLNSIGTDGLKTVINALRETPLKATGKVGYRHYAKIYGEQICAKYPEIKAVADKLKTLKASNQNIKKAELLDSIKPDLQKLGSEVDIVL